MSFPKNAIDIYWISFESRQHNVGGWISHRVGKPNSRECIRLLYSVSGLWTFGECGEQIISLCYGKRGTSFSSQKQIKRILWCISSEEAADGYLQCCGKPNHWAGWWGRPTALSWLASSLACPPSLRKEGFTKMWKIGQSLTTNRCLHLTVFSLPWSISWPEAEMSTDLLTLLRLYKV